MGKPEEVVSYLALKTATLPSLELSLTRYRSVTTMSPGDRIKCLQFNRKGLLLILKVIVSFAIWGGILWTASKLKLLEEKGCGCSLAVGVAVPIYIIMFTLVPVLHVCNYSGADPVIVEVGEHRWSVPANTTRQFELPDDSVFSRPDYELVATNEKGDLIEKQTLQGNNSGWIYNVKGQGQIVVMDFTGLYTIDSKVTTVNGIPISSVENDTGKEETFKVSKRLPKGTTVVELGGDVLAPGEQLPSTVDKDELVLRYELVIPGKSAVSVAKHRLLKELREAAKN